MFQQSRYLKKIGILDKHQLLQLITAERFERLYTVLKNRTSDLTIVLENVHDPHNVSAVMRSCDAVGVASANLVYYGGQKFPRLANTSSASAAKWLELKKFSDIDSCYQTLKQQGKKIYTTHMSRDALSLYDLDLTGPVALVFGNEHDGVSERAVEISDGNFLIPQTGMVQSLNISVACAVSLFEALRQRQKAGRCGSFSDSEIFQLMEQWYRREKGLL